MLEDNIEEIAARICCKMADAIELYANNLYPNAYRDKEDKKEDKSEDVPESFIVSSVVQSLYSVLAMTMETSGEELWNRHNVIRERWKSTRPESSTPVSDKKPARQKVDLVLYKGGFSPKKQSDFLCFVEFKRWDPIKRDVDKIGKLFESINTCRWGMVCGFLDAAYPQNYQNIRDDAKKAGYTLITGRTARPTSTTKKFQTFACILENDNYRQAWG